MNLFGSLDDETIRRYADEKEALFRRLYTDIKPVSGLIPFLDKMDAMNMSRAIATSAPRANVDFINLSDRKFTFQKKVFGGRGVSY